MGFPQSDIEDTLASRFSWRYKDPAVSWQSDANVYDSKPMLADQWESELLDAKSIKLMLNKQAAVSESAGQIILLLLFFFLKV